MKVPLLDLKLQYQTIKEEVMKVTEEIFESQYFILGPRVEALEKEIAEYCSSKHAVGVSSGTDALLISLMAADIGAGDSVITTTYTFFATAGSIARAGATPVFADIDSKTYNISSESVYKVIDNMTREERSKLKAIIPVHVYGQCCDMDSILEIAEKYNLIVIEDAAQAIKLNYLDGWTEARQANADKYRELFIDAGLDDIVNLPTEKENRHIYNQFVISLKEKRDELKIFLTDAGIGTEVYYPVPMHLQDCFSNLNYRKGDFPVSEYAASHTLALPVYPELSYEQQAYVLERIKEFVTL